MADFTAMLRGGRVLADTLTDVKRGEQALILTDPERSFRIAEAVAAAVRERGAVPVIMLIDVLPVPNSERPATVAAAMKGADVIFGFLSKSVFHTRARQAASSQGARMISATGIVEETLVGGLIEADFFRLKPIVDEIADRLTMGRQIRITSPAGTDLTASIEGRRANREIWSRERGQSSGAPSIEVNIPPLEGTAAGVLVVDASVASIGLMQQPIRLTVEQGRVTEFEGGPQAERLSQLIAGRHDPRAYAVAEIGIGLNPEGKVTGNIIEDESTFGTGHIALGNNTAHGGTNPAPIHLDLVFFEPTIEVDGRVLIAPGAPRL